MRTHPVAVVLKRWSFATIASTMPCDPPRFSCCLVRRRDLLIAGFSFLLWFVFNRSWLEPDTSLADVTLAAFRRTLHLINHARFNSGSFFYVVVCNATKTKRRFQSKERGVCQNEFQIFSVCATDEDRLSNYGAAPFEEEATNALFFMIQVMADKTKVCPMSGT
jgi:hypothetical protein